MGFKKKSPVYLKGEAVQSRNHSSVTIKFKFIKKLKRLPFGNRLTDFVQIFFVACYFWSSFKWAHFHQNLRGWVNKGVQLSMEWPLYIIDFELFIHISVNIIFKYHYVLIGKHTFIIFLSLFVIKNFKGTCLSVKMLKGYMARESLWIPVIQECKLLHIYKMIIE